MTDPEDGPRIVANGPTGTRDPSGGDTTTRAVGGVLVLFIGLQLTQMMGSLDSTIVATALPTISGDLGGFERITWIIAAYSLATGVSMPVYGKLGDLHGRRMMLLVAIAVFMVSSVACGFARTLDQLILARVAQGIGAGGLGTLSMAALADVFPARELARWIGYQGVGFAVSSIAGPLIGGLFVDHLSWRWAFWANVPLGLVAAAIVAARLPAGHRRLGQRIDWAGSALLVVMLSAVMLVATLAGASLPVGSTVALVALVVVAGVLFVWRQRTAPQPVLPLELLRDRVMRVGIGVNAISGVLLWCGIFFIPLFVQEVTGLAPTSAGFVLIPLMMGAAVGTLVAGSVVERTGRIRAWPVIGAVMMTAGVALLATSGTGSTPLAVGIWGAVLGIGIGCTMQPSLLAVQNSAPSHDLGVATSTVILARTLGSTIGVPIYGGILNAALVGRAHDAAGFAHAIPLVFIVSVPLAAVSIVMALRLPERPLRVGVAA